MTEITEKPRKSSYADVLKNRNLYLAPEQLTPNEANEKARPSEKAEERAARVEKMAQSILDNGQGLPVLIVEVEDKADDGTELTRYEYVDGGCRVEAIARINDMRRGIDPVPMTVWCSLADPDEDLFKRAVIMNLHRTQNSILDMAHIVLESRERNGWKGRGAGAKVASYLGIGTNRVSEYEKLLRAPASVKARIESGEIASLDAALKLMSAPEGAREAVADRAVEIAREEARTNRQREIDAKKAKAKDAALKAVETFTQTDEQILEGLIAEVDALPETTSPDMSEILAATTLDGVIEAATEMLERHNESADDRSIKELLAETTPEPDTDKPKVTARHVARAAREVGQTMPRSKSDIIDFFSAVTPAAYPQAAADFATYFVETWCKGEGTDKEAIKLFDRAVGVGVKTSKPVKSAKPVKKAAKKEAKPAATKKASKKPAKPAKKSKSK